MHAAIQFRVLKDDLEVDAVTQVWKPSRFVSKWGAVARSTKFGDKDLRRPSQGKMNLTGQEKRASGRFNRPVCRILRIPD